MATWLLQTNLISDAQVGPMREALARNGIPCVETQVVPFSEQLDVEIDGPVIPYGSNKLVRLSMARKFAGLYFDEETFDVRAWANRPDMLNSDFTAATAQDVVPLLSLGQRIFVRPMADLKAFPGTVLGLADAQRWMADMPDPDTLVAVSPARDISAEYRFFVVGGRVVTASQYRYHGALASRRADELLPMAQALADGWLPNSTCVMDVALTPERAYRIIEFNCINCSGFYDHDLDALVVALTNFTDQQ